MLQHFCEELIVYIFTFLSPNDIEKVAMLNNTFKRISIDKDVLTAKRNYIYNELINAIGKYKCFCSAQEQCNYYFVQYILKTCTFDYNILLKVALDYCSITTVI